MGFWLRLFRAPVTLLTIIVLATVYAGTHGAAEEQGRPDWELRREWGSVESLTWVRTDGESVLYPELSGPFDLWDGDWWRIPISALHHSGGFAHLLLNALGLSWLGRLLEPRWGSWRYALFLGSAAFVSLLPEYLTGTVAQGFSGVVCAMFGALLALRERDRELQAIIGPVAIVWVLTFLVLMALFSVLGDLRVANLAHFTGLAYGWGAGWICVLSPGPRFWWRLAFVGAHALLPGLFWLAVHPVWEGRYLWYVATRSQQGLLNSNALDDDLRHALDRNPDLVPLRIELSRRLWNAQHVLDSWRLLLEGLSADPLSRELWAETRMRWRRLVVTPLKTDAEAIAEELWGASAPQWMTEIRRNVEPPVLISPELSSRPTAPIETTAEVVPEVDPNERGEDWLRPTPPRPLPGVDPTDPRSALEGITL